MHHMEDLYINAGSKENASKRFIEVDMTKISHGTLPMGAYNLGDYQKRKEKPSPDFKFNAMSKSDT